VIDIRLIREQPEQVEAGARKKRIALDLGPWMTPAYTADSGIPGLVDALSSLLCAGQVSSGTKQIIISYVANPRFLYTTPTAAQMRDRVRAVAHLLVTSSEFAIQR